MLSWRDCCLNGSACFHYQNNKKDMAHNFNKDQYCTHKKVRNKVLFTSTPHFFSKKSRFDFNWSWLLPYRTLAIISPISFQKLVKINCKDWICLFIERRKWWWRERIRKLGQITFGMLLHYCFYSISSPWRG